VTRSVAPWTRSTPRDLVEQSNTAHDPIYAVLRDDGGFLTMDQIMRRLPVRMDVPAFERHLAHLKRDFHIEWRPVRPVMPTSWGPSRRSSGRTITCVMKRFLRPTKIS